LNPTAPPPTPSTSTSRSGACSASTHSRARYRRATPPPQIRLEGACKLNCRSKNDPMDWQPSQWWWALNYFQDLLRRVLACCQISLHHAQRVRSPVCPLTSQARDSRPITTPKHFHHARPGCGICRVAHAQHRSDSMLFDDAMPYHQQYCVQSACKRRRLTDSTTHVMLRCPPHPATCRCFTVANVDAAMAAAASPGHNPLLAAASLWPPLGTMP
jgi:hypothetical protein